MKAKTILRVALLALVAASAGTLVFNELRASTTETASDSSEAAVATTQNGPKRVVASYFHGRARCMACVTIERLARDAITRAFADELETKALELRSVNVQTPENQHYIRDYDLVSQSVVLALYAGDEQMKWKNLDRVWELLRTPDEFRRYVISETRAMLEEARS